MTTHRRFHALGVSDLLQERLAGDGDICEDEGFFSSQPEHPLTW